jgi:hypothetical protein
MQKEQLELLVESAVAQMRPRENLRIQGLLEEYRGRVALVEPASLKLAANHLERSISLNPIAENTSVCPLYRAYRELNLDARAGDLLDRFDGKLCE